jgi:hypothetical protein
MWWKLPFASVQMPVRKKAGRAVVVVSIGDRHQALYSLTRRSIEQYASRIDAVILNIDSADVLPTKLVKAVRNRSNGSVRKPLLPYVAKFWAIHNALGSFERVVALDSTCTVQSQCTDLFELVPVDSVGGWDESTMADFVSWKIDRGLAREKRGIDLAVYFNGGVIVASRCHRELFCPTKIIDNLDLFQGPYPQQLFLNVILAQSNASLCKLSRAYNYVPIFNYKDERQQKLKTLDDTQLEIICREGHIIHVTGYYEQRESVVAQICHRVAVGNI